MSTTTRRTFATAAVATTLLGALSACSHQQAAHVATARQGVAAAGPTSADAAQLARRYIACMRHHGVAMLDRLTAEGRPQVDKDKANMDRVGSAMDACRQLLPAEEQPVPPAAADIEAMRRYAGCLRTHGLPYYPDPDPDTGQPVLTDAQAGRLKHDPHLANALRACQAVAVSSSPGVVGG
jgi:hypothetical protein